MLRLAALLFALAPVPALANPAPPALTGPLAAALAQSATTPGTDADEGAAILGAILADFKGNLDTAISPAEKALLDQFSKTEAPFAVTLNRRRTMIGPLTPEARRLFDMVFGNPTNIPALLQANNQEVILNLGRAYGLPVQLLVNQSRALMANDLMRTWRDSTVGNAYEPLRNKLAAASRLYDTASPETRKSGRRLLYSAMVQVDERANGSVGDYLYSWLKD